MHVEVGDITHPDGPGVGVDRGDVAGAAVGSWSSDAQAFALADGESVYPVVGGQYRAVRIDHGTAAHPDAIAEEGLGVAGRDEADVMAVGLFGDGQTAARRLRADR